MPIEDWCLARLPQFRGRNVGRLDIQSGEGGFPEMFTTVLTSFMSGTALSRDIPLDSDVACVLPCSRNVVG